METAGSPLEPPKPEHDRKRKILPEIEFLSKKIEHLSSKLSFLKAKIISIETLSVPEHNTSHRFITRGGKKYFSRKKRNYENGLKDLFVKQALLKQLTEEYHSYYKKS